jgi:hypothetical protein
MRNRDTVKRESGYVLPLALGTLLVLLILGAALFRLAKNESASSQKLLQQDRGVAEMEAAVGALRGQLKNAFAQDAAVDLTSLAADPGPTSLGQEQGFYNVSLSVSSSAGDIVWATQNRPALVSLDNQDDPFRGARAFTTELSIDTKATRIGQPQGAYDVLSLQSQPTMQIRQIPVSQFSLYNAGADLVLNGSLFPGLTNLGRTYAMGNVTILNAAASTEYPLTAAGNVELLSGGALQARSSPESAPMEMQVASTTDPIWPSLAKSVDHSEIVSGRDLPMGMMSAATVGELTASPAMPSEGANKDYQRLYRQCSRVVTENLRKFEVSAPTRAANPDESKGFSDDSRYEMAGPVIVFDYAKVAPDASRSSYYIVSTNPRAMVLIRNATNLAADLSIVSPHPIFVSGGFNAGPAPKAASLISGSFVFAVPAGY